MQWLEQERSSLAKFSMIRDLAHLLHCLHSAGCVHRDLCASLLHVTRCSGYTLEFAPACCALAIGHSLFISKELKGTSCVLQEA